MGKLSETKEFKRLKQLVKEHQAQKEIRIKLGINNKGDNQ